MLLAKTIVLEKREGPIIVRAGRAKRKSVTCDNSAAQYSYWSGPILGYYTLKRYPETPTRSYYPGAEFVCRFWP